MDIDNMASSGRVGGSESELIKDTWARLKRAKPEMQSAV